MEVIVCLNSYALNCGILDQSPFIECSIHIFNQKWVDQGPKCEIVSFVLINDNSLSVTVL
jgi:hypothetical protein